MLFGLDWWVWAIIIAAVVLGGWLKLKVFAAMTKPKAKNPKTEAED